MELPNCPFYGRAMYRSGAPGNRLPFVLLDTHSAQCGLLTDRVTLCYMGYVTLVGEVVNWRDCHHMREVRLESEP